MASFFTGIEKAKTYGASQYLTPGNYTLQVSNISVIDSQRTPGRNFFLVEFSVVETDSPDYKAGSTVSWMVDLTREDTAHPNIKGFALALLPDVTDEDITSGAMDALIEKDQPARGLNVKAKAWNIVTRAGNDFTKVTWSASNGATDVPF